jgi:multiple sugar transport system ATP-binding protein
MARIDIDGVTKRFGEDNGSIVAVDDITMRIADGEFVVFVGPSGSGKSTLLRIVAGLEQQTTGDIAIGNTIVTELGPRARDIAMVFQNYALYPNMTVKENMSFGLKMSTDLSADEIETRVEDAAGTMGIDSLLDNTPGEMSGGQQQRVALGRAIVRDPNVFLMDEPLSNLDAKLRAQMRTEINRLQNDLGVTTLYVTHDQTEAMTMGDRLAVLNHGDLQQIGTPLECFYRPANRFVAGFLGSPAMNFFEGELEDGAFRTDGISYPLTDRMRSSIGERNHLVLGIRPEDMTLADRTDSKAAFEAAVDVVEPMGSVSYVYARPAADRSSETDGFEADEDGADRTFVVETEGQRPIADGDRVSIGIPSADVHLFDPDTGETVHQRHLAADTETALENRMQTATGSD